MKGKRFQVLGIARRQEEVHYLLALPDGTHTYLPSWMTQPQANLISTTRHPAVSLDALRRLKMIIDAKVQSLHDEQTSQHGGENVPNETRSADGIVCPNIGRADQDTRPHDAQNHESPGRSISRPLVVEQVKPKRKTSASRRPR